MDLIIVESPTKAKTLSRFLGDKFTVESTMGHVRDLPKGNLGIDIAKNFTPEYVLIEKKADRIQAIKALAQKAKQIYLATDPDREGEAIAYHICYIIKNGKDCQRIAFHEITEEAVKNALAHPRHIDINLVHAQQARRILDRLVGYKLSPILWKKVRSGLSAGRVQSVTVRLIVEREKEIAAFKPEEYWEIFAHLTSKPSRQKQEFIAQLIQKSGEKIEIKTKAQADPIIADLKIATYQVASVDQKTVVKSPPAPFTTSTMQQKAANLFGWSAKRTMQVAQRLYEHGLITYHRTDSTNIAAAAITAARQMIKSEFGPAYLPPAPRLYKRKSKLAQEAHEAIRPTSVTRKDSYKTGKFAFDAQKLYHLIRSRFLACQMADAAHELTQVDIQAQKGKANYLLRAQGKVVKFLGWLAAYGQTQPDTLLPEVKANDPLNLIKLDPQQKFTLPPPRYTEASLIKNLEKMGIGRPSTYAPIISTIQDRQYVEKQEGKFFATGLGTTTSDFLVKYFDQILDYGFTAQMEDQLDDIAKGDKQWVPVVKTFYGPFEKKLVEVEAKAKRVHVPTTPTGKPCPKCGKGKEVIRVGRFGKFLSCSRFPKCDYTAPLIEKLNMKCPECDKGQVVIKKTRKGKSFYGCSRYPDCHWASWKKPQDLSPVAKKSQAE